VYPVPSTSSRVYSRCECAGSRAAGAPSGGGRVARVHSLASNRWRNEKKRFRAKDKRGTNMAANISTKKQKEQTVCPVRKLCVMSTVVRRSKERFDAESDHKGFSRVPFRVKSRGARLG
jgi:hypothetical protein